MTFDPKAELRGYLRSGRDAVLWKLDGLGEYDIRRPLTPTGTNLLGLVKHLAGVEVGYFGLSFGKPFPEPVPWLEADEPEPNVDMWATAEESREYIAGLYRRVWKHSDETIGELDLDAVARVPGRSRPEASLHKILVHVATETHRHAGHADVVRELVDGTAGLRPDFGNLPEEDAVWWASHRARVEGAAREAGGRRGQWKRPDPGLPGLSAPVRERAASDRDERAWDDWWARVTADPALAAASAERTAVLAGRRSTEWTPAATWHIKALAAAGYAEAGLGWRHGPQAAVVAARGGDV